MATFPQLPPRRIFLFFILWIVAAGSGFTILARYESTPGNRGSVPGHWPVQSRITRQPGARTLVLFAHPRCPCTKASIKELKYLMEHQPSQNLDVHILFYNPKDQTDAWSQTELWRTASEIKNVKVELDHNQSEAELFQVKTSGHILVYDSRGELCFSGGITGGRGRAGENAGREGLLALLRNGSTLVGSPPVFGCSLLNSK